MCFSSVGGGLFGSWIVRDESKFKHVTGGRHGKYDMVCCASVGGGLFGGSWIVRDGSKFKKVNGGRHKKYGWCGLFQFSLL